MKEIYAGMYQIEILSLCTSADKIFASLQLTNYHGFSEKVDFLLPRETLRITISPREKIDRSDEQHSCWMCHVPYEETSRGWYCPLCNASDFSRNFKPKKEETKCGE